MYFTLLQHLGEFRLSVYSSLLFGCSNLSGSFALIISYYLGIEGITYGKIVGLMVCFGGVVLVALHDIEDDSSDTKKGLFGDFIALLAALGYAIYTSVIRKKVRCLYNSLT